jgi:hypothetical protein
MSQTVPNSNDNPSRNDSASSSRGRSTQLIIAAVLVCIVFLLLVVAVRQARHASRLSQSRYNLKSIAIALHTYVEGFQVLPPGGIFDADGNGYFGWQVSIMPYVVKDPLYYRIDQKGRWNDSRNAALFRERFLHIRIPLHRKRTMQPDSR